MVLISRQPSYSSSACALMGKLNFRSPPLWDARTASFAMFTSFDIITLMRLEERPRFQKMKRLAQKLMKWQKIEKLWQKHVIDSFSKIGGLALCKFY